MNLILFEEGETDHPLPFHDPRAVHLKKILRRSRMEEFDAGIVNGPRGKAKITGKNDAGYLLDFHPADEPPPLHPVILAVRGRSPPDRS